MSILRTLKVGDKFKLIEGHLTQVKNNRHYRLKERSTEMTSVSFSSFEVIKVNRASIRVDFVLCIVVKDYFEETRHQVRLPFRNNVHNIKIMKQ